MAALRTDERGTDPALAGSADLAALVDEYRRAGLVDHHLDRRLAARLAGPVGTALHRIAREALANVARHAAGNRVELRADGPPATACASSSPITASRAADRSEQRRTSGSSAWPSGPGPSAAGSRPGPTADGWRVEARLPVSPAERPVRPS